jgi:UDP-galactopyranose mutase
MNVLIVGTGLAGCLAAYFESKAGNDVYMVEREKQFGGLCRSQNMMGIDVHLHGPHVFHTNDPDVWKFMNSISPFEEYFIKVKANTNGNLYSFPINLTTLDQLGLASNEQQAADYFKSVKEPYRPNIEGLACSTIGRRLYELFVRDYTEKQWGIRASELPDSILKRIPYRTTRNDNYYNDRYSGVPVYGWTSFLEALVVGVKRIEIGQKPEINDLLSYDGKVIYTGRLDELFGFVHGPLQFRSVYHSHQIFPNERRLQDVPVINHCDNSVKFTRTIEHKFLCNDRHIHDLPQTVLSFEYSLVSFPGERPSYPIETPENLRIQSMYEEAFEQTGFTKFGRLASYRYMNMDQVVEQVMNAYCNRSA